MEERRGHDPTRGIMTFLEIVGKFARLCGEMGMMGFSVHGFFLSFFLSSGFFGASLCFIGFACGVLAWRC